MAYDDRLGPAAFAVCVCVCRLRRCHKWRVLLPHVRAAIADDAPWYCHMHPDAALASCEAPEEEEEEEEEGHAWEVGEAERKQRAAAALAAAREEDLTLPRAPLPGGRRGGADARGGGGGGGGGGDGGGDDDGDGGAYAHVFERPSAQGTPCVAAVPLDAHGILAPSAHIRARARTGQPHRALGESATAEEAALLAARFVHEYEPDHAALLSGLLGDMSDEQSRATLLGTHLDFYWPIDDVWCVCAPLVPAAGARLGCPCRMSCSVNARRHALAVTLRNLVSISPATPDSLPSGRAPPPTRPPP